MKAKTIRPGSPESRPVLCFARSGAGGLQPPDRPELARLIMRLRRLDQVDPGMLEAVAPLVDDLLRCREECG